SDVTDCVIYPPVTGLIARPDEIERLAPPVMYGMRLSFCWLKFIRACSAEIESCFTVKLFFMAISRHCCNDSVLVCCACAKNPQAIKSSVKIYLLNRILCFTIVRVFRIFLRNRSYRPGDL